MGAKTSIQWSDATWSPLRVRVRSNAAEIARSKNYTSLIQVGEKMAGRVGQHCEHVSDGCLHCYSGTWQGRCLTSGGTGLPFDRRSRDLVEPFVDEQSLGEPLRWKTPKKIFVENQSDLFGEWYTDEMIDRVFAVMALCPQHTFQVLTKRSKRMLEYLTRTYAGGFIGDMVCALTTGYFDTYLKNKGVPLTGFPLRKTQLDPWKWPLPNVWLGVSVEDRDTYATRVRDLVRTPCAVHFISYEPALQAVHIDRSDTYARYECSNCAWIANREHLGQKCRACFSGTCVEIAKLDWVIVGGESGPGARPFDVQWARTVVEQCRGAGMACFVKQLGAVPMMNENQWHEHINATGNAYLLKASNAKYLPAGFVPLALCDRKGGDMSEWPSDLCVRQFPGEQPVIPASQHRADEFHEPEPEC